MNYSEDLIQYIWQYTLFDFSGLETTDGEKVTILSPGILNTNSGPDFEQARIKINNTLLAGSVEIHKTGSEWKQHNHHKDKAYNSVVLHVCFHQPKKALRQDGSFAPCVSIKDKIDQNLMARYNFLMNSPTALPCSANLSSVSALTVKNGYDRMAVERLESKSKIIETLLLETTDWSQIAFAFFTRAFGAPVNSHAFFEIAQYVTFKRIAQHSDEITDIEALLFGAANLLESENLYAKTLAKRYALFQKKYDLQVFHTGLKRGKMRPANLPTVRLAQLAAIIHRYPNLPSLLLEVHRFDDFEKLCCVEPSSYWQQHYSFESESKTKVNRIARSFISHLYINGIAPLQYAYGKFKLKELQHFDIEQLACLKAEKNRITKLMSNAGFANKSAFDSQALIQLHSNYCVKKRCLNCNIGKEILSRP